MVGGVALGLPFAGPSPSPVAVLTGALVVAVAWIWGTGAGIGGWSIGAAAFVSTAVAAIGGAGAFRAWHDRVRRDVSADARYLEEGVLVEAEPGYSTIVVGDGPAEYCATMKVATDRSGFRAQTGLSESVAELLARRCDLTPNLFDRVQRADEARETLEIVVLPGLIRDPYDRPALDGYRFPDEIGFRRPLTEPGRP